MLYIRADGNTDIGMGHVMRCLSVAEAAAELSPTFITADTGCRGLIEDRGFRAIVLNTDYKNMMGEPVLLADLFDKNADVLLVDSYQVSRAYYLALKKLVRVACFEDMGQPYPVDLLINYNIYAPDLAQNYTPLQINNTTTQTYPDKVLLGVDYMPLRKAFQEPSSYRVADSVTDITITTGGSDPYFATASFVDALIKDRFTGTLVAERKLRLHLVSGPFNRFADDLRRRYLSCEGIIIHENVRDMRGLLLGSDVVISATGSTIYEVSALGVPMIVFYFAKNQQQGAEALEMLTDIVNAGCFADDGMSVTGRVTQTVTRCILDKTYRERLNRQEKSLIDGKGAMRIAGQLTMQNT
ncbi:MAG: hypothetical protein K2N73_09820 [Lachnospiraceae bacterium]|nr:hypothetical protein [Lachnospiraceae bacterium]